MTVLKSNLILATMFFSLVGATVLVSATCADADSVHSTSAKSISSLNR